jgi:hypothetical protein
VIVRIYFAEIDALLSWTVTEALCACWPAPCVEALAVVEAARLVVRLAPAVRECDVPAAWEFVACLATAPCLAAARFTEADCACCPIALLFGWIGLLFAWPGIDFEWTSGLPTRVVGACPRA